MGLQDAPWPRGGREGSHGTDGRRVPTTGLGAPCPRDPHVGGQGAWAAGPAPPAMPGVRLLPGGGHGALAALWPGQAAPATDPRVIETKWGADSFCSPTPAAPRCGGPVVARSLAGQPGSWLSVAGSRDPRAASRRRSPQQIPRKARSWRPASGQRRDFSWWKWAKAFVIRCKKGHTAQRVQVRTLAGWDPSPLRTGCVSPGRRSASLGLSSLVSPRCELMALKVK